MDACNVFNTLSSAFANSLELILSATFITIIYFYLRNKNLPPGPTGLPYLGYWPFLKNKNMAHKLEAMKKKYGDVFSFTVTGRLLIHLGSIKAVREAHVVNGDCFDRPKKEFSMLQQFFENGLSLSSGEEGHTLRKFFVAAMKKRAVVTSKHNMIDPFYDTIKSTMSHLKEKGGKPVNFTQLVIDQCLSFLRILMFGGVGATREQIRRTVELQQEQSKEYNPLNFLLIGTFARYFILPFKPKLCKAIQRHKEIEKILLGILKEHESTYDEDKIRDIIDDYLKERDLRRSKGDTTSNHFSDISLLRTLDLLVPEGVLNVATTIHLIIKYLIENPEEQEKIYEEIIQVVGKDRQPTVEDRSKLTRLTAFVLEVQRKSPFLLVFPSMECIKETTLNGYRIPKGALTIINFFSCNNDPEVYEEPEKFNPSRFLATEGKRRAELPMFFGVGKRSCLGEGYSMILIIIFLATLIQNFELKSAREISNLSTLLVYAHSRRSLVMIQSGNKLASNKMGNFMKQDY